MVPTTSAWWRPAHCGVENGLVGDLLHVGMRHQAHGPAGIVIGSQRGIGENLFFEQDLGQASIGLVELDDKRTGRDTCPLLTSLRRSRAADFDSLQPQDIDDPRNAGHIALAAGIT